MSMPETRNTPGVAGYLLAWAVSVLTFAAIMSLGALADRDLGGYLVGLLAGVFFVGMYSVLLAPPGILLVHVCCRNVPEQWIHVAAAAGAGVLAGIGWGSLMPFFDLRFALLLGGATAIGRGAVLPLVPTVRARRRADFVVPLKTG